MALAPRREIKSRTIKNALKNIFVPAVIKDYNILSLRSLWETNEDDIVMAQQLIAAKRLQVDAILFSVPEVHGFVSCLTAMTYSKEQVSLSAFSTISYPTILSFCVCHVLHISIIYIFCSVFSDEKEKGNKKDDGFRK